MGFIVPKSMLQNMFDDIRDTTVWDINGDMLWGYFFICTDRPALERAAQELEAAGYHFVIIHQPEIDGKLCPEYVLHVEKVETHTVDSLDERNAAARQNSRQVVARA